MAHTEARAWWADVQHLRDDYERTDEARRHGELPDGTTRRETREARRQPDDESTRPALRRPDRAAVTPVAARRTVEIRGRTVPAPAVPRDLELERRRPPRRAVERIGAHPDRLALWALLMALMLILVAVGTADASVLAR